MRLPVVLVLSACIAALAGCVTGEPEAERIEAVSEPPQVAATVVQPPLPDLSPRERLRKAIGLLEVGDAELARRHLAAYMEEVPNSRLAGNLIQQIDTDPVELFGPTSYAYAMRPGESLSIVAKRALGDAMLFHALARYNGIANPSAIKAGQVIQIPGAAPSEPATATAGQGVPESRSAQGATEPQTRSAKAEDRGATSGADSNRQPTDEQQTAATGGVLEVESQVDRMQDLLLTAQGLSEKGNYRGALALYEESMVEFPENAKLKRLAAVNYATYAGQLGDSGRPEMAIAALRRAMELDPDNPNLRGRLPDLRRQAKAKSLYDSGLNLYADDKLAEAYDKFSEAASVDPTHLGARQKMAEIAPVITDRWHREALTHYQRQDLKTAMDLWDKVLRIDPTHAQAQVYRTQAKDLDEKLRTIDSDSRR